MEFMGFIETKHSSLCVHCIIVPINGGMLHLKTPIKVWDKLKNFVGANSIEKKLVLLKTKSLEALETK